MVPGVDKFRRLMAGTTLVRDAVVDVSGDGAHAEVEGAFPAGQEHFLFVRRKGLNDFIQRTSHDRVISTENELPDVDVVRLLCIRNGLGRRDDGRLDDGIPAPVPPNDIPNPRLHQAHFDLLATADDDAHVPERGRLMATH